MLWVKTRVGLCALRNDFEIRAYKWDTTRTWGLVAQVRNGPDTEGRGIFRKFSMSGPWLHLAYFRDHADVEVEIGKAMQVIVDAVKSNTAICDLSQMGTADAWTPAWKQIRWP
jgi:hypothetical protein